VHFLWFTVFIHLIIIKLLIIKIVATRCQILRLKMYQIVCGLGLHQDPARAPQTL